MAKLKVDCPQCSKSFEYYSSDERPFCSKRCRLIDLGNWFDESYSIPSSDIPDLDELEDALSDDE